MVTAVTAQNARSVTATMPVPAHIVTAQFAAAFEAFDIAAVKSGMLVDIDCVAAVARALRNWSAPHYVLDPVIVSSSGHPLLEADAVTSMLDKLAPMAELVTPNVPEIEMLTGRRVRTLDDARDAATVLLERGCRAVLVKGAISRRRRRRTSSSRPPKSTYFPANSCLRPARAARAARTLPPLRHSSAGGRP